MPSLSRPDPVVVAEFPDHLLPHSEVMMHMRVAGSRMAVLVLDDGRYPCAQLLRPDRLPFSAPVTLGEAGIRPDGSGGYEAV